MPEFLRQSGNGLAAQLSLSLSAQLHAEKRSILWYCGPDFVNMAWPGPLYGWPPCVVCFRPKESLFAGCFGRNYDLSETFIKPKRLAERSKDPFRLTNTVMSGLDFTTVDFTLFNECGTLLYKTLVVSCVKLNIAKMRVQTVPCQRKQFCSCM